MLRRVLARGPLPPSLPVSAALKPMPQKAKLAKRAGINVSFITASETTAAGAAVPVGFTGKAGEVDFKTRWPVSVEDADQNAKFAVQKPAELLAGLGTTSTVRDYRLAVTSAVRKAKVMKASYVSLHPPKQDIVTMTDPYHPPQRLQTQDVIEKTACFAVTAAYQYDRLKSQTLTAQAEAKKAKRRTSAAAAKAHEAAPMQLVVPSSNVQAVRTGEVIGHCVNDARNLGNLREDEGVPEFYVEWAKKYMLPEGIKVRKVLRGQQLEDAGLNLMYNVGRGSRYEPYMMVLEYVGNKRSSATTALIGKGVTFDCGGLNVKPYGSMETMHTDMMGAATALTTLKAVATLKLPINVVAAVGLVENAIGPDSYHPSSIITSLKGLTVEVLNTDAEGRLVLADVLTYVQRHAPLEKTPKRIVDLATLTGAIIISLGSRRAGIFASQASIVDSLMTSGTRCGEELWPMPIGDEHKEAMRGNIADLINAAPGRQGGSCTAAAFLSNFIEPEVHWAHLDIAGVADVGDKPKGYEPAGVTGYGVQLLVDFLRNNKL
ncbi:cytosolic leucyl aminopeptidase metallo-peptidase Clan MF Family M17 [Leptomonas seymouri]|uniref:Cytosolic leucyl aminopeptidase metallo-peptidase Clan MF Family M17 n=1 Tax=Leptomonas seymouri TaxID=5684 RepID=A0A0N0P6B6_LEPSE|nr:cytosolic leucyl aminopeptidase metallo-peptidase Clan MF Family M17 [Leptomonas seymouri]|eukprot:KPI87446.1 cytosolic leucyl aminopeptidase metallo-peptidase Clan MF Family M17 [Leptomonas seymouri]